MKRLLVVLLLSGVGLGSGSYRAEAQKQPDLPPLPNFDKRHDRHPARPEPPPPRAAAAALLQERVPGIKIATDSLFESPQFIASPNGFLTGPRGRGKAVQNAPAEADNHPHAPLRAFLNEHWALFGFGPQTLDAATLKRDYVTSHNGLRTVVWEQHLDGIPVFDSAFLAHITRDGELVNISSRFLADPAAAARGRGAPPRVSAANAVLAAAGNLGEVLALADLAALDNQPAGPQQKQRFKAPHFDEDITAQLVWAPLGPDTLVRCWDIDLTSAARGETFRLIIDADTGEILVRRSLTVYISDASYRVFTSDSPSPFSPGHPTPLNAQPALVTRSLVVTPALNTNASPNGWINDADNETRGNNVDAHLDRDRNNQPDLPRPQGNPNRVFDFPLDLTQSPATYGDTAVVQLFYWCNFTHDKLWELGFNEAAGNFQNNNFGRGGLGNDGVLADGQDGSGFNNANFTFRPDGQPPRIQMYLFDGPDPDRDGDFDAEVIIHEYVHGLSSRLVGGGVGISELQTAGMGEGWSDWYALMLLSEAGDDLGGNYAAGGYLTYQLDGLLENYYYGIRRYPYSTNFLRNPLTFKDIDPTQADGHAGVPTSGPFNPNFADEVHNQGEVWCVTLWDARVNLVAKHGFTNGNQIMLQLVTDGMKLAPVNPNFLQARDAIIQADIVNNGGANFFELWSAFAKRGMGSSASSPASGTTVGLVEAFDLPGLGFNRAIILDTFTGNGNGAIDFNECSELLVTLINNDRNTEANISATLTTTTPGVTISQADSLYPNIPGFAIATNVTPFRIYTSPAFLCGTPIDFSLEIRSARDTRTLRFRVATGLIGAAQRFDNFAPLPIPDFPNPAVESVVNVSGFSAVLAKITVSLHITHTWDEDLTVQLIAPDDTRVVLVAQKGGDGDNFGVSCSPDAQRATFDDKAAVAIASGQPPFVGSFRPDQALGAFVGKPSSAVNGAWRLRIKDSFFQDTGRLECWSLNLSPAVCLDGGGDCSTDLAVSGSASQPALIGSNLVYSIVVTNQGPNTARTVTLLDTLPPSVQFVSASSPRGSCSHSAGVVTCNLGTLARREASTVSIVVRPTLEGLITNNAAVTTTVIDSVATNDTVSIVTLVRRPVPIIIQDVVTLVSESAVPPNGALDVGETVTLNFGLRNVGPVSSTDLQVKLLNGNGVADASPQQSYGILVPNGPPVYRPFSFRVTATNGQVVTAILQLQNGTNDLGTVTFAFGVSSTLIFASSSIINIPDSGPAGLYPSRIFVSGVSGLVSRVAVRVNNLSHDYPLDIDMLLTGPAGGRGILMSDAGGSTPVSNVSFNIDDAASSGLSATQLLPGTFKATDFEPGENLPAPAPPSPYSTNLTSFMGLDPNGFWSLYVHDDQAGDSGRINGGWTLTIQTIDPVNPETDLAISIADVPDPLMVGSNLTYTVTVTNSGPDIAGAVVVTNILPAAANFISAVASQGSCSFAAGRLVCDLGSLTNSATASITIVVQTTAAGVITLTSSLTANALDFHLGNNSATATTTVSGAADLQLALSDSPDPVFINNTLTWTLSVSNAGPNTALGVMLSNTLPAGVTFASALPSQGSCSQAAGLVNCSLGSIAAGASATVTIQATTPSAVVTLTNRAGVRASSPIDPNTANNVATAATRNLNPSFIIVAAGALLQSETPPATGGVEAGERVTVQLFLRNTGSADTTDLVATLLASGGVTSPTGPQNYGRVARGAAAISRSFSFTAAATSNGMVTATLQLAEGTINLGTAVFTFPLGSTVRFASAAAVNILNQGPASIYPAPMPVGGMAGQITKLSVTLSNFTHSYPDDVDILLVSPAGQKALLLSDVGGAVSVTNRMFTLDDAAPAFLPDSSALVSGTFRLSNFDTLSDQFPAPAPAAPYATNLATFNGADPNGTWSLYINDDTYGDTGRIEGWSLAITTVGRVNPAPPRLLSPAILANGRVSFTISGEAQATYLIEASTDLLNWVPVGSVPAGGSFTELRSGTHRFYRALPQP
jgi:uncharacterized repeat protein (TIGR01451 family)